MNKHIKTHQYLGNKEQGAILLVSLIFLLLMTIIAISGMKTGIFELLMASNEQSRVEAFQRAQSVTDDIYDDPSNIPVAGVIGDKFCKTGTTIVSAGSYGCVRAIIDVASSLAPTGNETLDLYVQRVGPLYSTPPRVRSGSVSATAYTATKFQIDVDYDGTVDRKGRSQLVQGVMVLVPSGK